ncbi:MAG TPA: DNA gyrase subunit A [Pseudogracilibacillus sp.]|nr:DNA gyrase subunit A [Pseudogracilibacillus sp.]
MEQRLNVEQRNISEEMRTSFLDYAMSVIVSRALPDVRDGLKPVHRRILYAMHDLGMHADKPYKKSARIVGDVIGKYHPHGDSAVYEAMVRMAQEFSHRYLLVDGHGNFGSVDGDSAAAMRYTEARMSKLSMELVRDIQKDTVDFTGNYDESEKEPTVFPARFPNLLVNGSSGIAVGMATNMPPHNLGETIDAVLAMIDDPDITVDELMEEHIHGPDFPTGGTILGRSGIRKAYETGRGSITIRAKVEIVENKNGTSTILVTEIPYQVNKAKLIEKIAELVRDKRIDGITDLNDESDRNGMRIVMQLRRDVNANVLLNNLYKHTALQTTFGINMLALVDGTPRVLQLKEILHYYLQHQIEIIRRRTQFDLNRAEARAHILEGLRIALDHLDEVIALIRNSKTAEVARTGLIERFKLSEKQAQAILDMRLQRLTGLEREKIEEEYAEILKTIEELKAILASEEKVLEIIREELIEIKEKYNDDRRTDITIGAVDFFEDEDLIPEENIIVTLTHRGYIKRLSASTYRTQHRGGRGIQGMDTHDDDFVEHLLSTSTHDTLLFFTNKGKVYRLKGYEIPEFGRTAKGLPIINILQIDQDEEVNTVISVRDENEDSSFLFFTTKQGLSKRVKLSQFANIRRSGLIAVRLRDNDELMSVRLTDGSKDIGIATKHGYFIRFDEEVVRPMGRNAAGVIGIRLRDDDEVVSMEVIEEDSYILHVTNRGIGKRTEVTEYRRTNRGGLGYFVCRLTEDTGHVVSVKIVTGEEDLMLITVEGVLIRIPVDGIPITGRNTQGVRLIRIRGEEEVATVAKIVEEELDDEEEALEDEAVEETIDAAHDDAADENDEA